MKTIVLISCCAKKLNFANYAEVLYDSDGFKARLAYARLLDPDGIYVISALHHVIPLTEFIEPYDVCLKDFSADERKEWARLCLSQLDDISDRKKDKYVILAGKDYYEELIKGLVHYEIPTQHLSQFKQTTWLKSQITCDVIHTFANSLPRFEYPFEESKLPENGVCLYFRENLCVTVEYWRPMDKQFLACYGKGEDTSFHVYSEYYGENKKEVPIDLNITYYNFLNVVLLGKSPQMLITAKICEDKFKGVSSIYCTCKEYSY